jgi:hypothetical protein
MEYDVYLARGSGTRFTEWDLEMWPGVKGQFERVARVEADNLEQLFSRCQHRDDPWHRSYYAEHVFLDEKMRSLSVGDLAEDLSSGAFYRVDTVGFTKLTPNAQPA